VVPSLACQEPSTSNLYSRVWSAVDSPDPPHSATNSRRALSLRPANRKGLAPGRELAAGWLRVQSPRRSKEARAVVHTAPNRVHDVDRRAAARRLLALDGTAGESTWRPGSRDTSSADAWNRRRSFGSATAVASANPRTGRRGNRDRLGARGGRALVIGVPCVRAWARGWAAGVVSRPVMVADGPPPEGSTRDRGVRPGEEAVGDEGSLGDATGLRRESPSPDALAAGPWVHTACRIG